MQHNATSMHNKCLFLARQLNHQVIHTCATAYKRRNNSIAQQHFQSCDLPLLPIHVVLYRSLRLAPRCLASTLVVTLNGIRSTSLVPRLSWNEPDVTKTMNSFALARAEVFLIEDPYYVYSNWLTWSIFNVYLYEFAIQYCRLLNSIPFTQYVFIVHGSKCLPWRHLWSWSPGGVVTSWAA